MTEYSFEKAQQLFVEGDFRNLYNMLWQRGADYERERLIELIEGLFAKSVVPGYQTAVADAIALIKGESK
jgi:hypothetical protein